MSLQYALPVRESTSIPCASECFLSSVPHATHSSSCRCVHGYEVGTSSNDRLLADNPRHLGSTRRSARRSNRCRAISFSDESGHCNVSSSNFCGFPNRGGNLLHGYRGKLHSLSNLQQRSNFVCSAHSMGSPDTHLYESDRLDQGRVSVLEEAYEKTMFLETSVASPAENFYSPHPEALDPFSQILYNHAMGRNLQWWRFLSSCRAQLHNTVFYRLPRMKYSLVGTDYKKVVLPSGHGAGVLPVPAFTLPLTQDPFSTTLDRVSQSLAGFTGYFAQMGNRYGARLLCLLVLGYWIQGFRCFPWMATFFYLKDGLQVDPATLQFWIATATLPMVAKPVYGILSDVIYIGGERRMPYLMFAGAVQMMAWSTVALHAGIRSSVGSLMGVLLVSNIGAAIAEVVNDALVAESVQKETGRTKGELQSFVWLALAVGGVLGNLTGGLALSSLSTTSMFAIFAFLVAGHFFASTAVKESSFNFKSARPLSSSRSSGSGSALKMLKLQASKLADLVSMPEIALPLAWFAASYAVIPAVGGSLFFFQTQHLKIHPTYLGLAKVIGQMGLLMGSLMYNKYLKKASPRRVLTAVQILLSACTLADIVLVSRLNIKLGIPDQMYVLGASAFVEAIGQFKILPFTVLLTQLCPAGSEGSLLAFFMSCHCLAMILSGYLGTMLSTVLRISASNFGGLGIGIVVQSLAALIPLFWISCIPSNASKVAAVV